MIIGFGNDLVDIRRIEKTLEKFGDRFVQRIFTSEERVKSETRLLRAASYAKRFASKEACAKALGNGFRKGVFWRDIGVINLPSGKPTLELKGGANLQLKNITPQYMRSYIHLSITDEYPLAQASVIISVLPDGSG